MIPLLAWRNLWRNRRRTFITVASILFAIVFANTMDALLVGINKQMTDSMVGIYSGHLQIQQQDFWEDKSLHNTFIPSEKATRFLDAMPEVKGYTNRLESVALASAENLTKGVLVVGIEPEKEKRITGLEEKIQAGSYFHGNPGDAIIGKGLAEYLDIQLGDTLVMIGEGYHGASAAGKYHICGILRMGSPDLDNNLVFLSLPDAQSFFAAYERATSMPVFLKGNEFQQEAAQKLSTVLAEGLVTQPWQKMMPMVTQSLGLVDAMRIIVLVMLYFLISFGILGTIIMMANERLKEFKVLLAVGMQKSKMAGMLLLESVLIALMGAALGFLVSYPAVSYLKEHPITFRGKAAAGWEAFGIDPVMPSVVDFSIFILHTLIILVIAIVLSLYALNKIRRLKVVTSKR
ncbi:MAG: ABC transporter permease [Lewinellaceae bacterium]|nr:ABC transporter permease [Phaeodactylibacter sp.]MCB9041233.1 ABC transporter permease [Lewinellaceae bacterium]